MAHARQLLDALHIKSRARRAIRLEELDCLIASHRLGVGLIERLGRENILHGRSHEPTQLGSLDGKMAIQLRLILPTFASVCIRHLNADAGREEGEANGEHEASVGASAIRLDGRMSDPLTVLLVLLEGEIQGRQRGKAVLLLVTHHAIDV
eukprot:937021-Prymnesium_polylepis.3